VSDDNSTVQPDKSARRRALIGRFARTAILVCAVFSLVGWGAGLWDVARHQYAERAMPHMARFAFVRALGPVVAMGLVAGLWAGLLATLSRWANRNARRERRTTGIALLLLALAALIAIARRYPMWAHMAQNAGYTGQSVNVWLGAIMLGVGEYVQSTLVVRVE
jgi:MFS family permease